MKNAQKTWVKACSVALFLLCIIVSILLLRDTLEYHGIFALVISLLFGCTAFVLWIFLLMQAGRRPNQGEIFLNWQDKIPLDLYLAVVLFPLGISAWISLEEWVHLNYLDLWEYLITLLIGFLPMFGLLLAFTLTLATRIKSGTAFRNTILYRLRIYVRRAWRQTMLQLPMLWRSVVLFCGYALISALLVSVSHHSMIPFFLWQLIALFFVWQWASQWNLIRRGTVAIVNGNTDYQINTRNMLPDLKEHATQLNNLGLAINNAVEERFKSEHFKAELITNVSHDLKTPLTSIINYVDLLKKENIENPTVQEYLEVLDRKSQRLKKLTEDLVEASKASTGNLAVEKERLDLVQLVTQATGEYEAKMAAQQLSLRQTLPHEPVYVEADGRHLWRILDNLLGNCTKYALEGTRVYLEVSTWDDYVTLAVKNISRDPLNIDPDALMERFVRGDESRTTEGSGLGLSIARSLTELQDGKFQISIDGDLFKGVITLPLAKIPEHDESGFHS